MAIEQLLIILVFVGGFILILLGVPRAVTLMIMGVIGMVVLEGASATMAARYIYASFNNYQLIALLFLCLWWTVMLSAGWATVVYSVTERIFRFTKRGAAMGLFFSLTFSGPESFRRIAQFLHDGQRQIPHAPQDQGVSVENLVGPFIMGTILSPFVMPSILLLLIAQFMGISYMYIIGTASLLVIIGLIIGSAVILIAVPSMNTKILLRPEENLPIERWRFILLLLFFIIPWLAYFSGIFTAVEHFLIFSIILLLFNDIPIIDSFRKATWLYLSLLPKFVGAVVFGRFLLITGVIERFAGWCERLPIIFDVGNQTLFFILFISVVFIVALILDTVLTMLVLTPFFSTLAQSLGASVIWVIIVGVVVCGLARIVIAGWKMPVLIDDPAKVRYARRMTLICAASQLCLLVVLFLFPFVVIDIWG